MIKEKDFQLELIEELEKLFPGCIILKNDPNYIQGFPDLLILFKNKWAALEVKRHKKAYIGRNQEYYIDLTDSMSFGAFIYPENKEEVLNELQQAFRFARSTRIS